MKKFALAITAASAVIAACFGPNSASAENIRMWTFLNPSGGAPREKALAEIIKRYEVANPGQKVIVEPQAWDQISPKFFAAHRAGNAPDIVWVQGDVLGDAFALNSLTDLGELFVNKWEAAARAERNDGYWKRCTQGEKLLCLYHSRSYFGVMYRIDLLKEAGIDPKTLGTWPAFIEAAKKLTVKDANGTVTRWGFGQQFSENQPDPQLMTTYLFSRQGDLFDDQGRAKWANQSGVEALKLQTEMVTVHGVTPRQASSWSAEDLYEQFAAGRLAMTNGHVARVSTMQSKLGSENVGFMLWPGIDGKPHSPGNMTGFAVGIWSGSKSKRQAGQFLEFMSTGEADRLWVEMAGQLPAAPSTLTSLKDFISKPANAYLVTAVEGVANYGWLPSVKYGVGGHRQALNKAAQDVVIGGVDPLVALTAAEKRFNQQNGR